MTCVVGLVDAGRVHIGADSAGVSGWYSVARADEKVFRNGPFVMGFTDSFRMGQLLRYVLVPPTRHQDVPVFSYMVGDFVNAVRECLKAGGFAAKEKERESAGTFLVGYAGRLFEVYDELPGGRDHPRLRGGRQRAASSRWDRCTPRQGGRRMSVC